MLGFVIMCIEKGITAFICIGLFAMISKYVGKVVHLSTTIIRQQIAEIKSAISYSQKE